MLLHLHVKNLALISEAEVDFGPGLNILTGETGAGKSILLGSMQLILGAKGTKGMIRAGEEFGLVELLFSVEDEMALSALQKMGVEPDGGQVLLSRRISEGRGICRLNGETTTLGRLKDVASVLLDIHGQHEHQSLLYPERQLEILDSYGKEGIAPLREAVSAAFGEYRRISMKLKSMDMDAENRNREMAFLEFELSEIEKAHLIPGEDEKLEEEFRRMGSSKNLLLAYQGADSLIGSEGDGQLAIERACQLLKGVGSQDAEAASLACALQEVESLLSDTSREIRSAMDSLSFSEEEYYQVSQRLDLINSMKMRYGHSLEEISHYADKQQARLDELLSYEETIASLKEEAQVARKALDKSCRELSEKRQVYARELEEKIREGLRDLNFLDVRFEIAFTKRKAYREDGFDEVEYHISTNPGAEMGPLGSIVSGGELSRIMLAIKAILADKDHIETLIFDEIDTGISGRTAQMVSEKMAYIGRSRQVLCITHLPQIAAMADVHFGIEKSVQGSSAITEIHRLSKEEQYQELARLLSGAEVTEAVLENAKEMKRLAGQVKEGKKA